ncbi:MAG: ABC transporter ATP-binding protein [Paraclostridium sp.]|uniref:ABC transporter ATP-binding protein n=1 Tax=Paraclostridium sp. TaxID=2023273 RepID=UPI003F3BCCED
MDILNLQNISYESDCENILNELNLTVKKGDCISIVGPSGSGKSTLLKLCADLISPTEGEILYNNKRYADYNPIELRKKISYCIQIPYLFGRTVYDNLAYPFKLRQENVDKDILVKFLKKLNLSEDYLNKKVDSLSGGEKQRIALIRNLIFKPDILLLDEVTSGLDDDNSKVVEVLIQLLNKTGVTVLWITHDMKQSKSIFNKRVHIHQGKVIREEVLK